MTTTFFRDAAGFLIVFDVHDPASISGVADWLRRIDDSGVENPVVVFCGNKADLLGRAESTDEAVEERRLRLLDTVTTTSALKSAAALTTSAAAALSAGAEAGEDAGDGDGRVQVSSAANSPKKLESIAEIDPTATAADADAADADADADAADAHVVNSAESIADANPGHGSSEALNAPATAVAESEAEAAVIDVASGDSTNAGVDAAVDVTHDDDAAADTTVSADSGIEVVVPPEIDYFETSAKNGANVAAAVKMLTRRVVAAREAAAAAAAEEGGGGGERAKTDRFFLRRDEDLSVLDEWSGRKKNKCKC